MKNNYLNIYNNLIKLTRNKNLYIKLNKPDTFSDRLIILFFHLSFFLNIYKNDKSKKYIQNLFDFIIRQLELSIREIGYGDVSVNKKMKEYINLLYSIIEKVEMWETSSIKSKKKMIEKYLYTSNNVNFYIEYFEKYRFFLTNNTLNTFSKDIINFKI